MLEMGVWSPCERKPSFFRDVTSNDAWPSPHASSAFNCGAAVQCRMDGFLMIICRSLIRNHICHSSIWTGETISKGVLVQWNLFSRKTGGRPIYGTPEFAPAINTGWKGNSRFLLFICLGLWGLLVQDMSENEKWSLPSQCALQLEQGYYWLFI